MSSKQVASGAISPRPAPVEDRLLSLSAVGEARRAGADTRYTGRTGAGAGGQSGAQAFSGGQSERTVHRKGGARGYDGGKKIKGRKRHIVVDSQGSVLGVWVSPADVSDARGARVVLEGVPLSVSVGADCDCGWGV